MINLWLDDQRRPGHAPHCYKSDSEQKNAVWEWATTVQQAKDIITKYGIDNINLMALDHDLGFCMFCQESNDQHIMEDGKPAYSSCVHYGDGTEFVRWMRDTNTWPKRRPTVHSFNPEGARRMLDIIGEHYEQNVSYSSQQL